MLIHASCAAFNGRGALVRGGSGSGKSSFVTGLMARGCDLVADDQVELSLAEGRVIARAPATLAGLIELRGMGILRCPAVQGVPVGLVVDLGAPVGERLPEAQTELLLGVNIPRIEAEFSPRFIDAVRVLLEYGPNALQSDIMPRAINEQEPL